MKTFLASVLAAFVFVVFLAFVLPVRGQTVAIGPALPASAGVTSGGTFSAAAANEIFALTISATGAPDHFTWTKNGGTASSPVSIPAPTCGAMMSSPCPVTLADGVTATFAATTGHALGATWTITTQASGSASGVGFSQKGIGAKASRSVEDVLRDRSSLLDFPGADPTGATDSSAAIMAAWKAVQQNVGAPGSAYGGTLNIPCGTFQIAHTVVLSSSLAEHFVGSGGCTVFNWTGDAVSPMFLTIGCLECDFGNFHVTNTNAPLHYGIWQTENAGESYSTTLTRYHDIHVQGGNTFEITGCTNATPTICTTSTAAPATGSIIAVLGFTTTSPWNAANGSWTATNISATQFSIPVDARTFGAVAGTPIFVYGTINGLFANPTLQTFFYAGCPTGAVAYNAGTAYGPGQGATYAGLLYMSVSAATQTGNTPPTIAVNGANYNTYWAQCLDGNNDQMHFSDVHVYGAAHSAFTLNDTQVFDVLFERCSGLDTNIVLEDLKGSFSWHHGDVAYSFSSDFFIASAFADSLHEIDDVETENSAQFLNASAGVLGPPPTPGAGGLSPNDVKVTLRHITHDGLGTGCTATQILTSVCQPSGHYIQFNQTGSLHIEDSKFNLYGANESIFVTGAYNYIAGYGPVQFTVKNVSFGFGNVLGKDSIFGIDPNDDFYTRGGGSLPTFMDTTYAYNGSGANELRLLWYPFANGNGIFSQNSFYNLNSTILTAYNATVLNSLSATQIQAYSNVVGAATCTGTCTNSLTAAPSTLITGGVSINPYPSTLALQIWKGALTPISAAAPGSTEPSTVFTTTQAPAKPAGSSYITLSGFTGNWTSLNGAFLYSCNSGLPVGCIATVALPATTTSFSIPIDSSTFTGPMGAPAWSYGGDDTFIWQENGGGVGGGPSTFAATAPVSISGAAACGTGCSIITTAGGVDASAGAMQVTISGYTGAWTALNGTFYSLIQSGTAFTVPVSLPVGSATGTPVWIMTTSCALTGESGGAANISTSTLTIATGAQTLTTQTGLTYSASSPVDIVAASNIADYMLGTVTSYTSATGVLVVNITSVGGSGTFSSWNVGVQGTVTATDLGHGLLPAGELVTVAASTPTGYEVSLALPSAVLSPEQFQYPVATCPGAWSSGGTLSAWAGPIPAFGPSHAPQNLSTLGVENLGSTGLTVQFGASIGNVPGDIWTWTLAPSQAAVVAQFGISGNNYGTSGVGPVQIGGGQTFGPTPVNGIDFGDITSGPHITQHRTGLGIANRGQGGGATATATVSGGAVATAVVGSGGTYGSRPSVVVTPTGGDTITTPAVIVASMTGGSVSSLTITTGGAGYTHVPVLSFSLVGADAIVLDTANGFNPRVGTLFSAAPTCASVNAGALWNISDLTGGLNIGNTATGTGTAGSKTTLIECNGVNWLVATGNSGAIPYPGAGVPLSTGTAWGMSYAVGIGANNLVQLNGSGQLPAVSGVNVTNVAASTAAALASTPSLCASGSAPTGILASGNATGCAVLSSGGAFAASMGVQGAATMTGSPVALFGSGIAAPALATGACYQISVVLWNNAASWGSTTPLRITVDGTAIQTISNSGGGSGYFESYGTFAYCNGAASQTAQTIGTTGMGQAYCASAALATNCGTWTSTGYPPVGTYATPTGVNWASGHTINITGTLASGTVTGTLLRISQ